MPQHKFGALTPGASAEIAKQIEAMDPKTMELVGHGFSFALADSLSGAIRTGEIDLNACRALGLDQNAAISIAEAIAKRHARVAAAMSRVPAAPPAPAAEAAKPEPAQPPSEDDVDCALWQLAELSDMIARGESCPTKLHRHGYSESTAKELADLIRLAHPRG